MNFHSDVLMYAVMLQPFIAPSKNTLLSFSIRSANSDDIAVGYVYQILTTQSGFDTVGEALFTSSLTQTNPTNSIFIYDLGSNCLSLIPGESYALIVTYPARQGQAGVASTTDAPFPFTIQFYASKDGGPSGTYGNQVSGEMSASASFG